MLLNNRHDEGSGLFSTCLVVFNSLQLFRDFLFDSSSDRLGVVVLGLLRIFASVLASFVLIFLSPFTKLVLLCLVECHVLGFGMVSKRDSTRASAFLGSKR